MKLFYKALGFALGLVLVGCKAQEADLGGKVSRPTRLTLEDRFAPGQPNLSGSALGTCLVQVVPASATGATNRSDLAPVYAQGLLDLGTGQVTLTLPLDTSLRLVRKGWKSTYQLSETKPNADGVGFSDPFVITSGTESLTLSVPLDEAPALASQSPADGATGVALSSGLALTFNNPLDLESLSVNGSGTSCTGTLQLSADDFSSCVKLGNPSLDGSLKVVTLTPAASLASGATYKLKVTQGVLDQKGNGPVADLVNATGFKTLTPDTTAPTVSTGTLATRSVGSSGLTLSWTAASDETTAASALTYQVFYSTSNNMTTVALTKSNGTAANTATVGLTSLALTGLADRTTYYFNVIVTDAAGNGSLYSGTSATTTDGTAPVVSNGTVTRGLSVSSVSLSWTAANDETTAASALTYQVFYSTANNLTTAALAKANGTAANSATANLTALTLANPGVGTYYFNVVVTDEAGNSAVYAGVSATFSALLGIQAKRPTPKGRLVQVRRAPVGLWGRRLGSGF